MSAVSFCVHFVWILCACVNTLSLITLPRAVEQSLADTREAAQMMGMSSVTFFTDPLNPHERQRHGKTPVGLKNLGNTCWFSVVVQVRVILDGVAAALLLCPSLIVGFNG